MALEIGFEDAIVLLDWKLQHSPSKLLAAQKQKNHFDLLKQQGFERQVRPLAIDGNRIMELLRLKPRT
ncbi:MAG: hypothetical protein R2877_04425 [Bdellovibrionota bacterium]